MIQQIRIQNFRSLKDVTLDLQQVNLLIGPNNSGKTNLLRAFTFLRQFFLANRKIHASDEEFDRNVFFQRGGNQSKSANVPLVFEIAFIFEESDYLFYVEFYSPNLFTGIIGMIKQRRPNKNHLDLSEEFLDEYFFRYNLFNNNGFFNSNTNGGLLPEFNDVFKYLNNTAREFIVYAPDPNKFYDSQVPSSAKWLDADASNIVPFLFNLSQNYRKVFRQLESDLKLCVGDIVSLSTPPDSSGKGKIKLKFFDAYDNEYWAEDVSEGVLYFLALLCIINQPIPPNLLLLEEPEKGIHPRRIREVMDFIFDLAQEKGIQVIMTTHDTYVVDQFADIPEAVFVFDKKDGATQVKNLQKDIIEPANQLNEANGLPPTHYTQSLGEHWAAGFLGGVPR